MDKSSLLQPEKAILNTIMMSKHHMPNKTKKKSPKSTSAADEYQSLMKKALKQPGVKETMKVYGQYEQLVAESHRYLGLIQPKEAFSVSTSTS